MPEYPRPLTQTEHELLFWILPLERNGYTLYRDAIQNFVVIGEGRRGNGELILGEQNDTPDFDEPLAPVFAYGAIETTFGTISITAREISHNQASIEIVNHRNERVPDEFEESRRWTYSSWKPGNDCPQCLQTVREVQMHSAERHVTLAMCRTDKRLWVFDFTSEVNRLIPI
ncbi:MAG: hypothetical protein HYZ33_01320, partial [Ignavibacteriales bacterium]|nr:hypothetical protein [Ignavibacteriales bacterium]